jgi:hypothetical protein
MKRRCLDTFALRALMKATHLLGLALAERLRQYRDSGDRVLDRFANLQEQALHVAYLREAVEIHGSRWDKLPERQRPHYAPEAQFRIVRLKCLLALSAGETARLFRVSATTVLRWEDEARVGPERDTVGSLLRPVPPVRRYADVVRHLVQTMTLAGFPGDRSIALHLGRVGWKLSRRSVQRMRHEKPVQPPEAPPIGRPRAVRAKYPSRVGDWRGGPKGLPWPYPPFPASCPFRRRRDSVSSPRHLKRSGRISRTPLSCMLRPKGYETYPGGSAVCTGLP